MIADSSVCDGNVIVPSGFPKISEMSTPSGDMAIGLVGAPLPGQIIHSFLFPPQNVNLKDPDEYIIKHVAPQIRKLLIEHNAYGREEIDRISGLIGLAGSLYYFDNQISILKSVYDYEAVGSGREIALGSLYTTANLIDKIDARSRILIALQAAEELTAYVGKGIQLVRVKNE
jgi:ATP-dependent protease HslVU (ClpYQ) peptidase subunit